MRAPPIGYLTWHGRGTASPSCWPGLALPSALKGTWRVTHQSATPVARGANITFRFLAAHAYLVMTSSGNRPRTVRVLIDGRPIPTSVAGSDVHHGLVTVFGVATAMALTAALASALRGKHRASGTPAIPGQISPEGHASPKDQTSTEGRPQWRTARSS